MTHTLRHSLTLALLLAFGCPQTVGNWTVLGSDPALTAQTQAMVAQAIATLPDEKGYLKGGGEIRYMSLDELTKVCYVAPGKLPSGCSSPGQIDLLLMPPRFGPDVKTTALAHELCHLGLASGGGCGGPVDNTSDTQSDQCASGLQP